MSKEKSCTLSELMEMQHALYEKHRHEWLPHAPQSGRSYLLWSVEELGEMIAIIKKKGDSAIESNPASPLKNGEYYLTGKNKKFFDEYVIPVGEIIDNMKSEKNRPQFQKAFADKSQIYRKKTGI